MKKQLFSLFAVVAVGSVMAQTPSTSWATSQNAGFTNPSMGIRFMDAVDNNVCWVIGYDGTTGNVSRNYCWFSRTTNGGTNFTPGVVYASSTTPLIGDTNTFHIANLEGLDANTAWVCAFKKAAANSTNPGTQGSGAIHRTIDGGVNWTNMTATGMFTSSTSFADFVSFFTPSIGITVGDPVGGEYEIWRTTNGGLSWSTIPGANIPNPSSSTEYAITNLYAKQGTSNFWFGTNEGRMYYSTDAGLTWNVSNVAAPTSTVTEIAFTTPLEGVAYVVNGGAAFELYNTSNGGATWTQITPVDPDMGLNDIMPVPGTNMLASVGAGAGNQIISYSTDNGVSWNDWGSVNIQYLTLDFANNTTGWAGSFSDATNPAVGGIWKYTGAAVTGTALPTAAFSMPSDLCLTSASLVVVPNNSSTGNPAVSYNWSASPAGVQFSNPNAATPNIGFPSSNTYTVTLTVNNSTGLHSSSQVVNVQNCSLPTVAFSVSSPTACTNIKFTATNNSTGGLPAPSYSWTSSSPVTFSPSPVVSNPTIIPLSAGPLTITLIATNVQGSVSAQQIVTVQVCAPVAAFSVPNTVSLCPTATFATFGTTNSTAPIAGAGVNSYTWAIAPTTGVTNLTGFTAPNFSVKVTSTTIPAYTVTLKTKNASGTSSVTQVVTMDYCIVGLNENFLESKVSVYPNPAQDLAFVTVPANTSAYNVQVINILGSVVYEESAVNNTKEKIEISLAGKPKGVYFVSLKVDNQKVTRKIILE